MAARVKDGKNGDANLELVRHHMVRYRPIPDWIDAVDFWAHVNVLGVDECWPYYFHCNEHGYGVYSPRHGTHLLAHRVAWVVCYGPIPPGRNILHSCDNPPCCNPYHLRPGTQVENVADSIRAGTFWRISKPERQARGERHGLSKLTAASALQLCERRREGLTYVELAEEFGIGRTQARNVVLGRCWKNDGR